MQNNINKYYGTHYEEYAGDGLPNIDELKVNSGEKFYHYASIDAAKSILMHTDQKYVMWASHLSFLNDWEEFENGEKLILGELKRFLKKGLQTEREKENSVFREYVEEFIRAARKADRDIRIRENVIFDRNIFILCFCMEKNSLNQWKYYGQDSGVALEFDLNNCRYSGMLSDDTNETIHSELYKVIYDDVVKKQVLRKQIQKMYTSFLDKENEDRERNLGIWLGKIYGLCPLFKHADFKDEKECRLLFRPIYNSDDADNDVRKLVKYRKRDNVLLPYMEIGLEQKQNKPLITNIYIGPGENQDLLYKSMRHFVLYQGVFDQYAVGKDSVSEVDKHILKSKTPFRGR